MLKTRISQTLERAIDTNGSSPLSVIVLLTVTNWISHFFYFKDFGLYEDDYAFIADAMTRHASYLLEKLQSSLLFPQGRPVGFYCAAVLAFLGDKLGGLWVDYLIGFVITTVNAYLVYRLLRYTELEVLAVTGGLLFCLFPADTTKILLTHAFILQISLTFLLVASLCYLENHKMLAYGVILGSLLSYESAFMVFFGIPLFKQQWNRAWLKELVRHAVILSLFVAGVSVIRWLSHENRVSSLITQPAQSPLLLQKVLNAVTIGVNTSLSLFVTAPFASIGHWHWMTFVVVALCCLLFLVKFALLNVYSTSKLVRLTAGMAKLPVLSSFHNRKISDYYLKILKFLCVGLILSSLSYSLAFTIPHYPPAVEKGRLTSVHLAGTIGGSLIGACLLSLLFAIAIANRRKRIIVPFIALYMACLVGYQFTIQLDFKQSWQNQRMFWTDVLASSPDLDEKTTILVVNHDLPQTDYILTHSWADPLILKQIVQSPHSQLDNSKTWPILAEASWTLPPVLFLVPDDWQKRVVLRSHSWSVPLTTWQGYSTTVLPASTIILEQQGNHLMRLDGPITIQGQTFELKPKPHIRTTFKPGPLFKYLIDEPNQGYC
ncbi:MAG: hypothetical protein ACAF41_29065 [Leptolyngbya sp. BL-A-14]